MHHEYFFYEDGRLIWRKANSPRVKVGAVAGCLCKHSGYVKLGLSGKMHLAHRLVWEMFNGSIPDGLEIDHINHIRNDNRIENLRLVTPSENRRNMSMSARNKSGVIGVFEFRNKWRAAVSVENDHIWLGDFDTKSQAIAVREEAGRMYGFHKNHGAKACR